MSSVPAIYRHVIEDVIRNVRGEFQNEGVDERVLQKLREMWEIKLQQFSQAPMEDLNDAIFNPPFGSYIPNPPGSIAPTAVQQPYIPTRPLAGIASIPGRVPGMPLMGLRNIQQTDGLNDSDDDAPPSKRFTAADDSDRPTTSQSFVGQLAPEEEEDDDANMFESNPSRPPVKTENHDSELGSDLDGSDESEEEDDNPPDIVLAQFEKVSRAKNKWKCNLKDGIIRVNERDYVFHKATGDFEWI